MARDFGTRTLALSVLGAVHDDGAYANLVLPRALRESSLDSRDRGFATELVYGTLRREGELDVVIAEAAHRPVAEIDNPTLDILRLGVYPALFMRVLA
jgi:16S rRNA (cytosine967-C5)-methyltransferase